MTHLDCYREIWFGDFEFSQPPGERPTPSCLVAREWRTGRTIRQFGDELRAGWSAPFPTDAGSLFVAYYASAEMGCFLALDWPMPERVLDLFCEFRNLTNGLPVVCGNGLLGALAHFGIDAIESAEKEEMRVLAMRGEPFTQAERAALLDYCESDVIALDKLLPAMLPTLDLPRALIRGRYMRGREDGTERHAHRPRIARIASRVLGGDQGPVDSRSGSGLPLLRSNRAHRAPRRCAGGDRVGSRSLRAVPSRRSDLGRTGGAHRTA